MKTVQDRLREADIARVIESYFLAHPIDYSRLPGKSRLVSEIEATAKEKLCRLIHSLLELEPQPSEEWIFYAVPMYGSSTAEIEVLLSCCEDILHNTSPEHYGWEFQPWAQVLGSFIADTELTVTHIDDVLAEILYEMSFFGFDQTQWEANQAEFTEGLQKSIEEAENGRTYPIEDLWAEFGLSREKPDEVAEELKSKVMQAELEYAQYCRKRETAEVRELLLEEAAKKPTL